MDMAVAIRTLAAQACRLADRRDDTADTADRLSVACRKAETVCDGDWCRRHQSGIAGGGLQTLFEAVQGLVGYA